MGNDISARAGYDSEMPVSSEADNRGFISFRFVLPWNVLYAKALFRARRVGGNKTCKKLTLNKENTKSFMFSVLLKAFSGDEAQRVVLKHLDNSMQKKRGFLPPRYTGSSVHLFPHPFRLYFPPSSPQPHFGLSSSSIDL